MGRPRVIIASNQPEDAVRMISALNPNRYRVEHIFDVNEALLRARLILAHTVVVNTDQLNDGVLHELKQLALRVTPVILSVDKQRDKALALSLGGRFVGLPFEVATFKRAIYRAVSKTQDMRAQRNAAPNEASFVKRVILVHPNPVNAVIMAAVLRNQLSANCEVAISPEEALELLRQCNSGQGADGLPVDKKTARRTSPIHCVVAWPNLLVSTTAGVQAAAIMTRLGIPMVALPNYGDMDVSMAGQAAWDIAPQVRRSLMARDLVDRSA